MRAALALLAGALAAVALLAGGFYGLLTLLKENGGFWFEAWRILFGVPLTLQRVLMGVAVVAALAAFALAPLAWMERRTARAFARKEEELRADRPHDAVTPYEGEEGEGLAFDGPEGRLLLLRPEGGVGEPRVVRVPEDDRVEATPGESSNGAPRPHAP